MGEKGKVKEIERERVHLMCVRCVYVCEIENSVKKKIKKI